MLIKLLCGSYVHCTGTYMEMDVNYANIDTHNYSTDLR